MQNHQHLIIGVTSVILALAIASYISRLYAKRLTKAPVWWDDVMVGVGLVSNHPLTKIC